MKQVSLIGTVHEETGLANVSELLTILERIRPEVIFLEIPSAAFADYVAGIRSNVESTAATRFGEKHHVVLVPVDLPTPEGDFFRDNEFLFAQIQRRSPDYCRLIDWHSQRRRAEGFAYLNSERCSELWSAAHEAILAAIEELGDDRLIQLYALWRNTNALRDKAMIRNIEDYCAQSVFESGVFLVGEAHRPSIIAKLRDSRGVGSSAIKWDFSGFLHRSK